jgi:hypothetical protein
MIDTFNDEDAASRRLSHLSVDLSTNSDGMPLAAESGALSVAASGALSAGSGVAVGDSNPMSPPRVASPSPPTVSPRRLPPVFPRGVAPDRPVLQQISHAVLEVSAAEGMAASTRAAAVSKFVTCIHGAAAVTQAVLHSFVGDAVRVS